MPSVMLQRVGLDGRRWVIQSVCVVCGLSGQRARVGQRPRSAVTEKSKKEKQKSSDYNQSPFN